MPPPRARLPEVEWARRAAAGELAGTDWVAVSADPHARPFSQVGRGEAATFHHMPYVAFLPDLVREAVAGAVAEGELTLLEGAVRVMAWPEWFTRSRHLLWTAQTPVPALLARLLEAYGVDPEVHGHDPVRLVRLRARLSAWHPRRGELQPALDLLAGAGEAELPAVAHLSGPTPEEAGLPLRDEVFACRDLSWWEARLGAPAEPVLRVEAGLLRFQPARGGFRLRVDDVVCAWPGRQPLPRALLRLLPAWAVLRLVDPSDASRSDP